MMITLLGLAFQVDSDVVTSAVYFLEWIDGIPLWADTSPTDTITPDGKW
jgi:hypothetical protein